MCGIVGVMRLDGAPVPRSLLRTMADRLEHRGPDADGYWADGPVGLGHRRLSIIDVGGSAQPMSTPDDRLHLCFNGEILNFRSLRAQLNYPFRTDGDTEALLAVHHAHGAEAVHRLRGQFAYAVYDRDERELVLVRDRLGILPLYYYYDATVFAFASEVKALLPALPGPPTIDQESLDDYLASRSVPAPHTLFAGVSKLPAGHRLRVGSSGIHPERYWSVPPDVATGTTSPAAAVDRVSGALRRSVEDALIADVPVGAYLSGGVDSSLIVALMRAAHGDAPVETFAAGFGDPRFDELPWARRVSSLLGTRHHEVTVAPGDFTDLWHRLTWHRDAPMSEPADFAVFKLAELARTRVKVVLSGEGSDELFAGYPKYRVAPWLERASRIPSVIRTPLVDAVERRLPSAGARARIALRVLGGASPEERRLAWFAPFTPAERQALLGRPRRRPFPDLDDRGGDVVRRMLADDVRSWLPDNLLERGDRMSMAASLELRPPFLDHRLVELAFSLPSDVKVRRGTTKWVVKEIARRHLPTEVVDRRKVGFRVPLDAWFRGELGSMAADFLGSPNSLVTSLLDRRAVSRLLDRHLSGRANEESRIWPLLCLEVWNDVFVREQRPVVRAGPAGPHDR